MKKKKNPQDATTRNVRAAKRRSDKLKSRLDSLDLALTMVQVEVAHIDARLRSLEKKKRGRG